jgi:RNA polymerase sigma-70 factor (ECF subfamily)
MDQLALADRFDAQRPRLLGIAYRILGSLTEAEDAVQETWLRLQGRDVAAIENLEAWLTTVVGRIGLNLLRSRRPLSERPLNGFLPEPVVAAEDESNPEYQALVADAVGIALQVVLDTLSPAERVAFVLHDMFSVPFGEIAELLDRSPDAARQLASRARRQVHVSAPPPEPNLAAQRAAVDAYFAAARDGDLDALVAILDPEVVLRAHRRDGAPMVLNGPEQVSRGALAAGRHAAGVQPALVNGSAGVVAYQDGAPFAVLAFTVRDGWITAIDIFNDPELVPRLLRRR